MNHFQQLYWSAKCFWMKMSIIRKQATLRFFSLSHTSRLAVVCLPAPVISKRTLSNSYNNASDVWKLSGILREEGPVCVSSFSATLHVRYSFTSLPKLPAGGLVLMTSQQHNSLVPKSWSHDKRYERYLSHTCTPAPHNDSIFQPQRRSNLHTSLRRERVWVCYFYKHIKNKNI